ncbi:MAG: Hpt domain-containing response regulator, partial [Lentisphaeria bacterium]
KVGIYIKIPILKRDAINRLTMLKMNFSDLSVNHDDSVDCEAIMCCLKDKSLPEFIKQLLITKPNMPIVVLLKPNESFPNNLCSICYPIILPLRRTCCIKTFTMIFNNILPKENIESNQNFQIIPNKILLAEDNPINQDIFISMLRLIGYNPDLAENGEKAIALAKANKYDLILMDCEMPKVNGYEACLVILDQKSGSKNYATPIVAITAYNTSNEKSRAFQVGMHDFVPKPISLEQLRSTVGKFISRESTEINEPVNLNWIRNNLTSDETKIIKYLTIFIKSNQNAIGQLKALCSSDDAYKIVHKISGSAASLGITSIAQPAAELEYLLRENMTVGVDIKCENIVDAFNLLKAFTENYKVKIKNAKKNLSH